jgi:hypothetical protein
VIRLTEVQAACVAAIKLERQHHRLTVRGEADAHPVAAMRAAAELDLDTVALAVSIEIVRVTP